MTGPRRAEPDEVPVLIVGGGPVGLAASVALSRLGIRSLLVERHPGTSRHPKARGVDVRTMEVFRQWGLEADVRAAGLPAEEHGFFYRGATLTDAVFERFGGGGRSDDARRLSPASWLVIGQDALEPVLLERTRALGYAEVRFDHELVALEGAGAAGEAVTATILDRDRGEERQVRATFLLGADGAGSRTRAALGIGLDGRGPLVANASILFRADLADTVADRHSAVYYLVTDPAVRPRGFPMSVGNPPDGGVILTIDGRERWLLVVGLASPDASPPDDAEAATLVRRATGIADLDLEVLGVLPWTPAARVAATYRRGGAFLAGDAAHEMTPSGAFGLNVGIQDAANLAWKLAAVLSGWAGPALLDTYDAERRPVARLAAEQSYLQFAGLQPPRPFGIWGMILGPRYESAAVVPDGTAAPSVDNPATDYVPVARPGHRMPHAWLGADGGKRSTLDLLETGFTLLSREPAWVATAVAAAHDLGVPLRAHVVAGDLAAGDDAAFEALFEIGPGGAVLVRPDGYVAWRSRGEASDAERRGVLAAALGQLLCRSP